MTPVARFRNDRVFFLWGFAAVWDAATLLLAWVVLTDAGASPLRGLLAIGVFGGAAIGLTAWALSASRVRVDVYADGSVAIASWAPLRRGHRRFAAAEVPAATVVDESDGESSSFVCRVAFRGQPVDLSAHGNRDKAEAAAARFNAVAGRRAFGAAR